MLYSWRECNANTQNERWLQDSKCKRQVEDKESRNQTPSGNQSKPGCIQEKEKEWM
jgi:hypothetical protein